MRGRMSATGSDFMILEYNFNSSHSSEELMLHVKKQKKSCSHLSKQREADQEDRECWILIRKEGAYPQDWQLGEDLAK